MSCNDELGELAVRRQEGESEGGSGGPVIRLWDDDKASPPQPRSARPTAAAASAFSESASRP